MDWPTAFVCAIALIAMAVIVVAMLYFGTKD